MYKLNLRKTAFIGVSLMLFSLIFGVSQTVYFGSNWLPQSKAELICDIITMLICNTGCTLFILCIILKTIMDFKQIKK